MARVAAILKHRPANYRKSRDARNGQGRNAWPNNDVLTEQILESINTTPQEKVLQRIASLSPIRRGKVLDIRRQIADGTYEAADRLDRVMGRILEAITT